MKFSDQRPNFRQKFAGLFQFLRIVRVGIQAEKVQRRRQDIVCGIEHVDPTVTKFGQIFRLENDVPAVDLALGAEPLSHRLRVVADAGSAPHVIDGELVTWVIDNQALGYVGPGLAKVLKFVFVELLENTTLYLPLEKVNGGHHDIVAGFAGKQLRLERFIGIEGIVLNLDAGFFCEVIEDFWIDVIRPVVDIDHALVLRSSRKKRRKRENCRDEECTSVRDPIASRDQHCPKAAWPAAPTFAGHLSPNHSTWVGSPAAFQAMIPPARWAR